MRLVTKQCTSVYRKQKSCFFFLRKKPKVLACAFYTFCCHRHRLYNISFPIFFHNDRRRNRCAANACATRSPKHKRVLGRKAKLNHGKKQREDNNKTVEMFTRSIFLGNSNIRFQHNCTLCTKCTSLPHAPHHLVIAHFISSVFYLSFIFLFARRSSAWRWTIFFRRVRISLSISSSVGFCANTFHLWFDRHSGQ